MRYSKEEALEMGTPIAELKELSAKLPYETLPWANLPKLRAMTGLENDRSNLGSPPDGIEEYDHEISFRDGFSMMARVYRPKQTPARGSPLIVYYHGGGWITGSYLQSAVLLRRLVTLFNFVAVALPYRLAPEHPFPIPQHDAYDGLQWAAKLAPKLKADPSTGFIISGASAGGQLASVCAQHWLRENRQPPLTGSYYNISYFLDLSQVPPKYKDYYNSPTQHEMKNALILKTTDLATLDAFLKPDLESAWHSPFVAASPHVGMPPAYFQVAGQDPFRDHSLIYEDALRQANVRTKLDIYPGVCHAWMGLLPQIPQSKKAIDDQQKGIEFLLRQS